jgi:glycosyltransferase involved in cell wall biosynthesis
MSINKSDILIILPTFNEGAVLEQVLEDILKQNYSKICLVDDGSSDNTLEIAKKFNLIVLIHPINRGAGAAVQTGIQYARNNKIQYAVLMDSDGQHLPEDIEVLYDKLIEVKADIVIGNRFYNQSNDVPAKRIAYNKIANILTNIFCKNNYLDTQSGFRILNRTAIEKLNLKNKGFGFCSEMIIESEKLNLKINETPINVLYTEYSMSKGQNLREGVRTARSILYKILFE